MSHLIKVAPRKDFSSAELWEMHHLRAKVFKDKMGWEVPIIGGMEIDGYDAMEPYYMMIREPGRKVCGCWRALPTTGPYMLKDTFPELLHGHTAPQDSNVWELSRFAIETDGPQGFGFSGLSIEALRAITTFGDKMGIERYITVTTTSIERLLRRVGLIADHYGPPMRIGVENAVAIAFNLDEHTHEVLFEKMPKAA